MLKLMFELIFEPKSFNPSSDMLSIVPLHYLGLQMLWEIPNLS